MNPPSALHSAMNRERKPFTYTPGGLDLSEIKSERMAQRLMRNAMNEGVAETPAHLIKSPPASGIPIAIPNFNCMPVQVFPTFKLPTNPKSLLRTRSNPDGSQIPPKRAATITSQQRYDSHNNNTNRLADSMGTESNKSKSNSSKVSDNPINIYHTVPKTYNGYFRNEQPLSSQVNCILNNNLSSENKPAAEDETKINIPTFETKEGNDNRDINRKTTTEKDIEENSEYTRKRENPFENEHKQEEVKVIEKAVKKDVSKQNGDTETAVIVKLPGKKSAAKTETKVEVVQHILPDGSVQEVKTTTTRTTVDGKTEISTKTETRTVSKEETDEEVYDEEEEEEYEEEVEEKVDEEKERKDTINSEVEISSVDVDNGESESEDVTENKSTKENGQIIMQEEKVETSTTKKVVVESEIQHTDEEAEESEELADDDGDTDVEIVVIKKQSESKNKTTIVNGKTNIESNAELEVDNSDKHLDESDSEEIEIQSGENENVNQKTITLQNAVQVDDKIENIKETDSKNTDDINEETISDNDESIDEEEDNEEDPSQEKQNEINEDCALNNKSTKINVESDENKKDEEIELKEQEDSDKQKIDVTKDVLEESQAATPTQKTEEKIIPIQTELNKNNKEDTLVQHNITQTLTENLKTDFSEPLIPLEKVEEVEIKPICSPAQEIITKSHKEIITTTTDKPSGALSTQTQYNVIENIVTVNRTTKTLDQAGEYKIPVLKTSLIPDSTSYTPSVQSSTKSYETSYATDPSTERRHSLLLERLSMERQIPTPGIFHSDNTYINSPYQDKQFSNEPQSEVLTESNVKPSLINRTQQWYSKKDNYETTTSTDTVQNQQWQPTQHQSISQNQIHNNINTSQNYLQNNIQTQHDFPQTLKYPSQDFSQNNINSSYNTQLQSQYKVHTPQDEYYNHTTNHQTFTQHLQTQPQLPTAHTDTITKDTYKSSTDSYNRNSYPSYTPKPSWVSSTTDPKPTSLSQPNKYSFVDNESDIYQKSTQNKTTYVPPPWEQDATYGTDNFVQNTYYQPQPPDSTMPNSKSTSSWKPPPNKFTKSTPTSYIPPAPNQSFVKSANVPEPQKLAGRKTYYSEYERRYITVPDSTYIPTETKFQAQPNPSPKYYYDQNETLEPEEPQWRKELREFTEKTQTGTQTSESSARPPWEQDVKYTPTSEPYNTPSWSQTARPCTFRERSIEPEYTSSPKEWQKTNSLGRGRPQSSYLKNNLERIPERRGVSVDRYNPTNYESPLLAEHPPVQSQTLDRAIHPKPHYNPNVPAYHGRASAEPREQPVHKEPRTRVESRTPPVQSRSFKYLQWITGTED